ncbi:hypothetical protein KK141_05825 [Dyella sp. LX-66]|uniref:hypothetical protein n=1 Tax=unclassified Dyella TaxID=2634549 RepID=UPI001BE0369E|nr:MULTISPECIES: hypothetical protein [unclassified Dyella]MBT2116775.1 hypothetical protein [Dyella sp. LX-1]MBT2139045.1 hypothetical protein [Dyella sp. LX-66]
MELATGFQSHMDDTINETSSQTGWHPANASAAYVFLEEDGDVYHLPMGQAPESERILGSGLWSEDLEGYGYLTSLTQIGGSLYAMRRRHERSHHAKRACT